DHLRRDGDQDAARALTRHAVRALELVAAAADRPSAACAAGAAPPRRRGGSRRPLTRRPTRIVRPSTRFRRTFTLDENRCRTPVLGSTAIESQRGSLGPNNRTAPR